MRYSDLKYCLNSEELFLLSQLNLTNRAAVLRKLHELKKRTDDKSMVLLLSQTAEKIWYMPESVFRRVAADLKEGGYPI